MIGAKPSYGINFGHTHEPIIRHRIDGDKAERFARSRLRMIVSLALTISAFNQRHGEQTGA
jgi:hypothetical protein